MVRRQLPQLSLGMGSETEQMDLENIKFLHIEKKRVYIQKRVEEFKSLIFMYVLLKEFSQIHFINNSGV